MNTYRVKLRYKGKSHKHYEVSGIASDTIMGAIDAAKRKVVETTNLGSSIEESIRYLSVVAICPDRKNCM